MITVLWVAVAPAAHGQEADEAVHTFKIARGNLSVLFRDNAQSPGTLSGLDSLFNVKDAPGFDAFDPDSPGASAGINFEHIISGHKGPLNAFTPRHRPFTLHPSPDGRSVKLVRTRADDPWAVSSTLRYTVTEPHYVDVEFRCVPHEPARFGERGHAIFFFSNYMNDVHDPNLHFMGIEAEGAPEKWIDANAPKKHADWNRGGTYRSRPASAIEYDADHNFALNSWSYDYPRFTRPFYYGRATNDMTMIVMFDRMHSDVDEVRFSVFRFKLPQRIRPAWDFQYVVRKLEAGREYGFKARLVWKKFVSPEDCLQEYETWRKGLGGRSP